MITIVRRFLSLNNVDNTADADKPVSSAVSTALGLKTNTSALASVATSGAYSSLTGLPTLGSIASHAAAELPTLGSSSTTTVGIVSVNTKQITINGVTITVLTT